MKRLKYFFMLSILLLCFGFVLSSEVHAQGDGPKPFEVNDVLPATTQLRISWTITATNVPDFNPDASYAIMCLTKSSAYLLVDIYVEDDPSKPFTIRINDTLIITPSGWVSPYTDADGDHAYIDIDTSNWSSSDRTVSYIQYSDIIDGFFYWEDLNAPSGYSITFEENGGTTQTDLTDQTNLPTPLPTPTKSGYTFLGWYYDSTFTQIATAGDTIESDVTLYAKWGPKVFAVNDVLPAGYIKISWDWRPVSIFEDEIISIEGTNGFVINVSIEYRTGPETPIEIGIMGDYFNTIDGNIIIKLDSITVITEIKSDLNYISNTDILDNLFWEVVTVDEYSLGYEDARDKFGYYDPITQRWLSVSEYLDLYGYEKLGQTDFYNNFDKYFIPAMIIVFGGAIVLTILKVFKGRE